MKKNNPQIPIMLREASNTLPKVYARYGTSLPPLDQSLKEPLTRFVPDFGNEKSQSLEGLSDKQIEETVTSLVKNEQ